MPYQKRDVGRFGRWASTYDRSYLQRVIFEPVQGATLESAGRELSQPGRILDVGCGTGQLLRRAAVTFPHADLVGIDPAFEMIRQAGTATPDDVVINFVHGGAEALPFDRASFDLLLSTMSFHHWADQEAGLREAARVLRPGGLMVLTDALAVGWLRFAFSVAGNRGRFHTPDEIKEMFAGQGLRTIRRVTLPKMAGSVNVTVSRLDPLHTPTTY